MHSTGFEEQSATYEESATYLEQSVTYLEQSATYLEQSATSEQSVTWDGAEWELRKILEGFRQVTSCLRGVLEKKATLWYDQDHDHDHDWVQARDAAPWPGEAGAQEPPDDRDRVEEPRYHQMGKNLWGCVMCIQWLKILMENCIHKKQ